MRGCQGSRVGADGAILEDLYQSGECSSLKRCGCQPFQKAVWQRVFQGPGKIYAFFTSDHMSGKLLKGTDCKTRKERPSAR